MTQTITLQAAFKRVAQSGRRAAEHENRTEIIRAICVPGWHIRQGDVLLEFISNNFDVAELVETNDRQLAPGSTKGSRHVLEGDAKVYFRLNNDGVTGPFIVTGDRSPTVTHPEHRHYVLPPNTKWGVRYEMDERTKRRVLD